MERYYIATCFVEPPIVKAKTVKEARNKLAKAGFPYMRYPYEPSNRSVIPLEEWAKKREIK